MHHHGDPRSLGGQAAAEVDAEPVGQLVAEHSDVRSACQHRRVPGLDGRRRGQDVDPRAGQQPGAMTNSYARRTLKTGR